MRTVLIAAVLLLLLDICSLVFRRPSAGKPNLQPAVFAVSAGQP